MVAIKQPVKVSSFQERFSQLFFESGKSITELGEELHVSNQTVSAWKTGTRIPRVPAVLSIADYFGVDYRWLLGYEVEREPYQYQNRELNHERDVIYREEPIAYVSTSLSAEEEEMRALWKRASPAARRVVIAVLKSMENENL